MSDKEILAMQVSGFAAALVLLFFTRVPHVLFVIAFGVHFAGDLFRAKKDGLI